MGKSVFGVELLHMKKVEDGTTREFLAAGEEPEGTNDACEALPGLRKEPL